MNTRPASTWEKQRAKEIAQAILGDQITVLEAARALCPLAHTDAIESDEDRILIIAIDSETDSLPVGEVRKYWAPDALGEKDPEIKRAENLYGNMLFEACERIVRQ